MPIQSGKIKETDLIKINLHVCCMICSIDGKTGFVQNAVCAWVSALWKGSGSRIAQVNAVFPVRSRNMRMTGKKDIAFLHGRQVIRGIDMSMGHAYSARA